MWKKPGCGAARFFYGLKMGGGVVWTTLKLDELSN